MEGRGGVERKGVFKEGQCPFPHVQAARRDNTARAPHPGEPPSLAALQSSDRSLRRKHPRVGLGERVPLNILSGEALRVLDGIGLDAKLVQLGEERGLLLCERHGGGTEESTSAAIKVADKGFELTFDGFKEWSN